MPRRGNVAPGTRTKPFLFSVSFKWRAATSGGAGTKPAAGAATSAINGQIKRIFSQKNFVCSFGLEFSTCAARNRFFSV